MARIETVEEFAAGATPAQAAVFAVACAERAAAILFWVVSQDDRADDLDVYKSALDVLWGSGEPMPEQAAAARERIVGLQELTVGDEATGARAFAYQAAVALYTALGVYAEGRERTIMGCSSTLRNFAFRLGRRCGADLLTDESESQLRDVADLTKTVDQGLRQAELVRERSVVVGRHWLALASERFGRNPA
ncbi:hypothetical protein ACH4UM_26755 [Streptomyces sp. NPDC020801]|uniref:hypothetical protein n=1 Tax=unclassified Streptomyces TaxID=2593676 RepID=UPI0037BB6CFC